MNKVILMGRLTADPEVKDSYSRYTIAVDRRFKTEGGPEADFFSCTAFKKAGEFAGKYFKKGTKVLITGSIQNNNYTNKDGQKVYSVGVIVDEQEFTESKNSAASNSGHDSEGFMSIPDGLTDELPFA